jgi:asparagine synthase (glutamine-hydrolysing)
MCGIAGFIDHKQQSTTNDLKAMAQAIEYRGPDADGYEMFTANNFQLGFGHRRLSIIDLSPLGKQPMFFKELSIIFNGEIYNYAEIKKELEEKHQCQFVSHSDTEVILQAFYQWGIDCVQRFNGMFAIALYDSRTQKLYLIRDRAGVKPVYYYTGDGLFLFGSEIKSFHKHPRFKKKLNTSALALYLQYGYVPAPYSIFNNCSKVLPGHYIIYDLTSGKYTEHKYWDVYDSYNKPKLDVGYSDAVTEMDTLLKSACNYRMVSDVPVGVFLSGGYDSSTVAAMLQTDRTEKIKTFTIGFEDEQFNEAVFAKKVADYLGTDHTEHYCTRAETLDIVPKLPFYFDEPFGDSSAIPTMLVSALARKRVTVALSADGGDEAFAGYTRYHKMLNNLTRIKRVPQILARPLSYAVDILNNPPFVSPSKKTLSAAATLLRGKVDAPNYNKYVLQRLSDSKTKSLIKQNYQSVETYFDSGNDISPQNDQLSKVMAIDYKTYMVDDVLVKVDRAGMSVSLEGREPLLDYRIIEYAARLPSGYKYRDGVKKKILKDIAHKYLPVALMDRPKMGFGIPLNQWLRTDLKPYLDEYLNEDKLKLQGIFNVTDVQSLLKSFYSGNNQDGELLWFILMFQMWYAEWM